MIVDRLVAMVDRLVAEALGRARNRNPEMLMLLSDAHQVAKRMTFCARDFALISNSAHRGPALL